MLKRDRPGGGSPPTKKSKEKSGEVHVLCITCKKNAGEDSIECECCFKWEHRACAGVSKEEYEVLTDSSPNIMFFCSGCRPRVTIALKIFNDIEHKQKALDDKVKQLEEKLNSTFSSLSTDLGTATVTASVTASNQTLNNCDETQHSARKTPPKLSPSSLDRKFNVIVYGIEENPQGTQKHLRTQNDLKNLLAVLSELNTTIDSTAIKDLFRLGKYKSDNPKPRPLLVKFLRVTDVTNILKVKSQLKSPVYVKPDLTPEEQTKQSILLKERRSLIQKGTDRKHIKLRSNSILVNNQPYCELKGLDLIYNSSSTTSCPANQHKASQPADEPANQMDTSSTTTSETQP